MTQMTQTGSRGHAVKDSTEIDTGEFPLSLREAELPRAPSSSVRIDVAALSDKGKVRERNEDHYYVAHRS